RALARNIHQFRNGIGGKRFFWGERDRLGGGHADPRGNLLPVVGQPFFDGRVDQQRNNGDQDPVAVRGGPWRAPPPPRGGRPPAPGGRGRRAGSRPPPTARPSARRGNGQGGAPRRRSARGRQRNPEAFPAGMKNRRRSAPRQGG